METKTDFETLRERMPRYRSHKIVGALKISSVSVHSTATTFRLDFVEPGFGFAVVGSGWIAARGDGRAPAELAGGYLVTYENGYSSWSPADAFESGYTRLEEGAV